MKIDNILLVKLTAQADSSQRMLNAIESVIEVYPSLLYTMTLEQMLESIGEPVKNWRKKNKN